MVEAPLKKKGRLSGVLSVKGEGKRKKTEKKHLQK